MTFPTAALSTGKLVNKLLADWPQSAHTLLTRAKQECSASGQLVKLILTGTTHLDSWLIEHWVLPALAEKDVKTLEFSLEVAGGDHRLAAIVPLPDGTAFARSTAGFWFALEQDEARYEIEYIGFRYAPDNRWRDGFETTLRHSESQSVLVSPAEVARLWEEVTGRLPRGFRQGVVDQMQALGLDVISKAFKTQKRLGL